MNLITDAWIPIRTKSGVEKIIAPWRITEGKGDDEITSLAAPRPDFTGALIQFLIGLLQTTCAPENPRQWRQWLQTPPAPDELQAAFAPISYAFNLDGDGPRFMQDLTIEEEVLALPLKGQRDRKSAIYEILIDLPTGKTLSDNTDHFIKRGAVEKLCPACAAMALFTLQTNAPAGGQGNRTGLRGGGPMTTLLRADTLWETCWLNILDQKIFLSLANSTSQNENDRFPWLAQTRTSEGGRGTTMEDVHPDQIFWSMPRRIRLIISKEAQTITCDLCAMKSDSAVRHFFTKNLGIHYTGPWKHPLSPYFIDNTGVPSAKHPQSGGIGYRHWLGLVQASQDNKGKREPARVIEQFFTEHMDMRRDLRIWAFGYNMDNMKARCWHDSTMPVVLTDNNIRKTYEFYIKAMINCAQQISSETRSQIRKAMFRPGIKVKEDASFITSVTSRFWQETEANFFGNLYLLRDKLNNDGDVVPILEDWHRHLTKKAETIFNEVSQSWAIDTVDPKRVALAWRDLRKGIYSKKLREGLGLQVKTQSV